MKFISILIPKYIRGLLYGDGYYKKEENVYFFSTTHKEVSDKVRQFLKGNGIKYFEYQRENKKYENWELLEITEITDKNFIINLKDDGIICDDVNRRIIDNWDFIRGYLETKGTFFKFLDKNKESWRINFSGHKDDIKLLKLILSSHDIETQEIIQRRERESLGIISDSFRLGTQKRESISKIVHYIYDCHDGNVEITSYLEEKIKEFIIFNSSVPFNRPKQVFKHYKYAVGYMARELGLTLKGVRGGSKSGSGAKPVYLWEGEQPIKEFKGWEGAYNWIIIEYKKETGFTGPMVE